jgi:hypothetical protein
MPSNNSLICSGLLIRRQVFPAASISLNASPRKADRNTQLRLRVVLWRTVVNVDSIALVVRKHCSAPPESRKTPASFRDPSSVFTSPSGTCSRGSSRTGRTRHAHRRGLPPSGLTVVGLGPTLLRLRKCIEHVHFFGSLHYREAVEIIHIFPVSERQLCVSLFRQDHPAKIFLNPLERFLTVSFKPHNHHRRGIR